MKEIYVVIKVAAEKGGDRVLASTEKAFDSPEKAKAYMATVPSVWQENIQNMECHAERVVHVVNLE